MIAGGDELDEAAVAIRDDMENAVVAVVNIWRIRRATSAGSLGSPLAALVRGVARYVDQARIGSPSDFRSWILTVELCGKATKTELGFDALELLAEFSHGARRPDVAKARGWRRSQLQRNYDRAVTALMIEFCSRGVTREIRATPET